LINHNVDINQHGGLLIETPMLHRFILLLHFSKLLTMSILPFSHAACKAI
jgi:hypothetical protein